MLFVTPDYFEFEPLMIANANENGDVKKQLVRFIAQYEKQCLVDVLGACLYKEVQDAFTFASGVYTLKSDAPDNIKRLIEGYEYAAPANTGSSFQFDLYWSWDGCGCGCGSSGCTTRKWQGLVQKDTFVMAGAEETISKSFIGDFIYYHWMLINRSVTTGTGQQKQTAENSTPVQNASKRIDRWNEFVKLTVGNDRNMVSLYRFLTENKSDYPTWVRNCKIKFLPKF